MREKNEKNEIIFKMLHKETRPSPAEAKAVGDTGKHKDTYKDGFCSIFIISRWLWLAEVNSGRVSQDSIQQD